MRYSQEMDQYIRDIAEGRLCQEIAEMFNKKFGTNVTAANIKSYKSNHKIRSGKSNIDYSNKMYYNQLLNKDQLEYLKSIYVGITNRECTRLMNEKFGLSLTCQQIKGQKQRLKLNSGLDGRFKKGHKVNDNCFKKGERVSVETEFKKGQIPQNWVPVGTERIKSDGYVYVKITDRKGVHPNKNWKQKHRIIWEKCKGPIPEGMHIAFLDGNKLNLDIENMVLATKQEMLIMSRHNWYSDIQEVTYSRLLLARMMSKRYKLIKKVKKG